MVCYIVTTTMIINSEDYSGEDGDDSGDCVCSHGMSQPLGCTLYACVLRARTHHVKCVYNACIQMYKALYKREIVLYSERIKEYRQMVDITSLGSLRLSKAKHTCVQCTTTMSNVTIVTYSMRPPMVMLMSMTLVMMVMTKQNFHLTRQM